MKNLSYLFHCAAAGLLLGLGAAWSGAPALAAYPDKPIRLVVPFPAGTAADISARRIAQVMSESLKQSIVVENRGGAGGAVGSEYVAKAAPDGYTLLAGTLNTHAMNPAIYKDLSYDPIRDFEPITRITTFPNVLVVPASLKVNTLAELIALAKQREQEPLTYGSGGVGTTAHLSAVLLGQTADVKLLHIPYQGTSRAMTDVLAGRVDMIFGNVPVVLPYVKEGRLKALTITSTERSPQMPDVPTVAEMDMKNAEISVWIALFAPKNTPAPIIDTLSKAALAALESPALQAGYAQDGGEVQKDATPADFAAALKSDVERWGEVVRQSGATAN
ncbi:Bug family tripartite tricarboxylate transporter substrate binding protein [Pollutimonas bauzanensis]|uniref:Tripartite-type tricarboxylate transporter, receptor component TctC n=1 Tax=Pollutimonas bauzanensis TaxID=658167 RepID=A0A1M5Z9F7_9BURK|nr:tripartite tricarboxylate transporter substrate binding protein [Pollutimonas bauzanensis]SHI20857.1 Tripartite-type tricarboxylate transporter, receptor component TctC [Pollutimonas bauzanensis]